MNGLNQTFEADVCVVGAGVVGLAHALEARRRGLTVAVRSTATNRAAGASVRNFGHLFFTSVADGADFERAMLARERWLELIDAARLHAVPGGTLIVARASGRGRGARGCGCGPCTTCTHVDGCRGGELGPIPTGNVVGGFHSSLDLRVHPREAAGWRRC